MIKPDSCRCEYKLTVISSWILILISAERMSKSWNLLLYFSRRDRSCSLKHLWVRKALLLLGCSSQVPFTPMTFRQTRRCLKVQALLTSVSDYRQASMGPWCDVTLEQSPYWKCWEGEVKVHSSKCWLFTRRFLLRVYFQSCERF